MQLITAELNEEAFLKLVRAGNGTTEEVQSGWRGYEAANGEEARGENGKLELGSTDKREGRIDHFKKSGRTGCASFATMHVHDETAEGFEMIKQRRAPALGLSASALQQFDAGL